MRALFLFAFVAAIMPAGSLKLKPLSSEERELLKSTGRPAVTGVHRPLPADAWKKGKWKKLQDGRQQWRLEIQSPGARALRIEFEAFDAGTGAVRVCEKDGKRCYGPYSGKGPLLDGTFWSDVVDGHVLSVEFTVAERVSPLPFRIARLAHQQ